MNSDESRIIKMVTSAGGGKTYKLSERYIKLLKDTGKISPSGNKWVVRKVIRENLRKILAITFTNRAAGEMKERILNLLKEAHRGENELVDSELAGDLIDTILYNYSDFSVRTIDSFVNTLVKSFYIPLNLPPETELILDSDYYRDYALSKMIDSASENENLREILVNYLLYSLDYGSGASWNFHRRIKEALSKIEKIRRSRGITPEKPDINIDKKIKKKHGILLEYLEEFVELIEDNDAINTNLACPVIRHWENPIDLPGYAIWRKSCEELHKSGEEIKNPRICDLFEKIKSVLDEFYLLSSLRDSVYTASINEIYSEILENVKREERIRFIDDISSELDRIYDFYDRDITFIFYCYGETLKHYLIDEFQDTSRKQWNALFPLIENAVSEPEGSLFVVGDPKQAIYQWRGGEVELFEKDLYEFRSVPEPSVKSKKVNYRSAPEIINFTAEVFSSLPADVKDKISDRVNREGNFYYSRKEVEQELPPEEVKEWEGFQGFVSIKRIDNENGRVSETDEAVRRELLEVIPDILDRYNEGQVSILVRTNRQAGKIVKWLTESSYRVVSNETLSLSSHHCINGILSFLKFLQHPTDDIAFFGFISNPVFLEKSGVERKEFMEWFEEEREDKSLYTYFREDYSELWESLLEPFFKKVGFLPLYDLLSDIIRIFSIPENFPGAKPYIERFVEFVHNLEKDSRTSIDAMIDEWNRLESSENPVSIMLPEDTDAIQVMTMHSAKGLEFPVVVIPFLFFKRDNEKREVMVDYKGIKGIAALKSSNGGTVYPNISESLREELKNKVEQRKSSYFFEEINNFYVAVTRAQFELHIFVPEKIGHWKEKTWKKMVENYAGSDDFTQGKPEAPPENLLKKGGDPLEEIKMETSYKENIENIKNRLLLRKGEVKKYLENEVKMSFVFGNIIHKVLYYITDTGSLEDIDKFIKKAVREYAPPLEMDAYVDRASKTIEDLFKNERIRRWFEPGLTVWREKEFVDKEGKLLRMDRVVIKDSRIELIDYKTGEEKEASYREQVRQYADILDAIFPEKEVKSYVVEVERAEVIEVE